ncbi:MAG: restriction endonuclease subunit S, partial [Bacteroidetes bacterium CG_4_10_14_3_um_filter_42_6]
MGDVVIARTGNSTGATSTIKQADFRFIDFLLRSAFWKGFVKSIKGGSAQGGANAKNFAEFPILLPSLPEQKAIADVLTSFDDKIELLRQQNQTLEEMAQTLFKEWFVYFRFPGAGKMVDSELGMIPEGWKVDNIGQYVNIKGGTTPSTKNPDYWDGKIHWTSPKDLSN